MPMDEITFSDVLVYAALAFGLVLLGRWLLRTGSAAIALRNAPERPTRLPFLAPLVILIVWMLAGYVILGMTETAAGVWELGESAKLAVRYGSQIALYIVMIFFMGWLAWEHFEQRLKGFGLDFRHPVRDTWYAAGTLLAIMPVVMAMVSVVMLIGRLIVGDDFEMSENEGLTALKAHPELWLKAIVFVYAGVIVPVYEEMLFRGLFQSLIRSVMGSATSGWTAVIVASGLFAVLHLPLHRPALFVLSLAIGYSYEKSGSLVRAILIHSFFNMSMMAAALSAG
jgi:membrane protease YdiL (CAAX protease family)